MKLNMQKSVFDDVVAALHESLKTADVNGIRRDKLKQVMKSVTGDYPSDKLFNQVMWTVGYNTGTNGLYYAQGKVPEMFKKVKKEKKASSGKPALGKQTAEKEGQSITLDGDVVVTVKGAGHDFRSKAVKVIIFLSAVILFIVTNPLGLW